APRTFIWQRGTQSLLDCGACNPTDINDDGVIVGLFNGFTGFVYHGGSFAPVPSLPGASLQSDPWTINNSGEIWGTSYVEDPIFRGVLWRDREGRMRNLGTVVPGAYDVAPRVFSPRRGVVGGWLQFPDDAITGFIWDHGHVRLLRGPNGTSNEATDMNRD